MIRLFSFHGRASRLEYWRVVLLCVALSAIVILLGFGAATTVGPIGGVLFIAIAPILWLDVAAVVRRLHDRGKSVWWLVVFQVAPFAAVGTAQQLVARENPMMTLLSLPFSLTGIALSLWGWVEIGFIPGKPSANRFGDIPPYKPKLW
jgi:uncharacterized membrane protein YhaH (DUF805 family)